MSFTDAKPTDSKEQLLSDIFMAANQKHMPGLPLRPFAALVVKVADETADTVADLKAHITKLNEQNARLQWWVIALAVAALIGTIVQTAAALFAMSEGAALSSPTGSFGAPATPSGEVQRQPLLPPRSQVSTPSPTVAGVHPPSSASAAPAVVPSSIAGR